MIPPMYCTKLALLLSSAFHFNHATYSWTGSMLFRLFFAAIFFCATPVFAAPYIPSSDATKLERLPFKPNDPVARELAQMRAELQRDPRNLKVAVKLAQRYYQLVGGEGDPRYLGYAQAALAPWWKMPSPPPEVQLIRAQLRQFSHDFEGALTDIGQILAKNPLNADARVLRAVIQMVQARYDLARADCLALNNVMNDLLVIGCEAMVDSLTGKTKQAYTNLKAELADTPEASPDDQMWVLTRLADMSLRLGMIDQTRLHFKQALALNIEDHFLLAAYADFLLEQKQPAQVVALLKDKTRSDGLLLRLVFAERSLNLPQAKAHETALAARYLAAQLRGDTVHQLEEARFSLHVLNQPKRALTLAQENWKAHREPQDARIFLEAALALKDPAGGKLALDWMDKNHIEDPYLQKLALQLKGLQK